MRMSATSPRVTASWAANSVTAWETAPASSPYWVRISVSCAGVTLPSGLNAPFSAGMTPLAAAHLAALANQRPSESERDTSSASGVPAAR